MRQLSVKTEPCDIYRVDNKYGLYVGIAKITLFA